jgi:cell division protein FtsL
MITNLNYRSSSQSPKQNKNLAFLPGNWVILIMIVVAVLGVLQIWASHRLATSGERLTEIDDRIKQLQSDDLILSQEIYKAGSLAEISDKAGKMGLVKTTRVLNLTPEVSVAYNY